MPARFRCVQGHLWEDLFEPSMVDGEVRCPECGLASHPEPPSGYDATAEVSAVGAQAPSAPGLTRVIPGMAGDGASPDRPAATTVHPQVPGSSISDLDGDDVIVPSRRPSHAANRQAVDPAPRPQPADWPDIPGYEIEEELGRGGMGVVYKARQRALNRVVALKMILSGSQADERDRARFNHEAQAVARLQHPNIVQIFEVGEHQGQPYFSLEFVDGGSLADRLREQPVPVAEAARLIQVLAEAIHFAHQQGIIHRDLKPANILLAGRAADRADAPNTLSFRSRMLPASAESASPPSIVVPSARASLGQSTAGAFGAPKITDFGLAKTLDDEIHTTRSGMVVGTPGYMAPEQATGSKSIGPTTDVYALGVLLFQMITGQLPFSGDTPMDVLIKVTQQEPPPPSRFAPRLARDLETICLKCLEKDPARRYPSALELAEDLRRFLAHEPILARPVSGWEHAARWARRRPAVSALLATVLMAAIGFVVMLALAARAEQQRLADTRRDLAAVLDRARAAEAAGKWDKVQARLAETRARAARERVDELADLTDAIEALGRKADRQVAARAQATRFRQLRDDALFQASLATTGSTRPQWGRTLEKATLALENVGASASAAPLLDNHPYTDDEKTEIRFGCYELLLYLAEATAVLQPREPGEASRRAREALAILDTAARLGVRTHVYHLRRAAYLEQAGRRDEAARERRLAAALAPSSYLDHYLVGGEHLRAGDREKATRSFVEALRLKPDHFWARYSLARAQVMAGELQAARDNLTSCEGRSPVVWIYLLRGLVQGQIPGAEADAEADFLKAEKLLGADGDPGAKYALYNNRAIARFKRGDYGPAFADLEQALKTAPTRYPAYLTLAQAHRERKQVTEALQAATRGLETAVAAYERQEVPSEVLFHFYRLRAQLHLMARQKGGDARALADLDAILRLPGLAPPVRAVTYRDRGHQFFRSGRVLQALAAYDSAIRLAPADPPLHRWRAEALLKLHRYRDAVASYDRHLALAERAGARAVPSDLLKVYRSRAIARLHLGQNDLALSDFSLAVAQAPADGALRVQRGQAYLALKAWQLAAKDFDEALRLDGKSAPAHHGRGTARLQMGQVKEAAEDALAAAKLAGHDGRAIYSAACLLTQAAGQMAPDRSDGPSPSRRPGPSQAEARRHLALALDLLEQALEALPSADRAAFWRDTVNREAALRPLRSLPAYARLDGRFGP